MRFGHPSWCPMVLLPSVGPKFTYFGILLGLLCGLAAVVFLVCGAHTQNGQNITSIALFFVCATPSGLVYHRVIEISRWQKVVSRNKYIAIYTLQERSHSDFDSCDLKKSGRLRGLKRGGAMRFANGPAMGIVGISLDYSRNHLIHWAQ